MTTAPHGCRKQPGRSSRALRALLLLAAGISACGPVDGPAKLMEERLQPWSFKHKVVEILGEPSSERTLTEYEPPVEEIRYRRLGITAQFDANGVAPTLRYLRVTRRWITPIHGVRVGDEIAELRKTISIVSGSPYADALRLEAHPDWLVRLDETGERIEWIQLINRDARSYTSHPR